MTDGKRPPPTPPKDPLPFLPRGPALLRRLLLAEVLGPPRCREPWRSPSETRTPDPVEPAGEA